VGDVDESALVAGIFVPLPLFDRNQGAREAARSDVRRGRHEQHGARVQLAVQLTAAYQEAQARLEELGELREGILPAAEAAFAGVQRGYGQGLFRNVDVLDAQRRLFELRLREIEALRAYHAACTDVEQLTGAAPGASLAPPRGTP
jgi:cobalt-zinc-cadmium efflux system outer membrane protein